MTSLIRKIIGTQDQPKTSLKENNPAENSLPQVLEEKQANALRQHQNALQASAQKYGISIELLSGLMLTVSGGDADKVNDQGAQGLFQLHPQTAKQLGIQNPFDPKQNIEGAARLFRGLLDQHGGNTEKALAAYWFGSGIVQQGITPKMEAFTQQVMAQADLCKLHWKGKNFIQDLANSIKAIQDTDYEKMIEAFIQQAQAQSENTASEKKSTLPQSAKPESVSSSPLPSSEKNILEKGKAALEIVEDLQKNAEAKLKDLASKLSHEDIPNVMKAHHYKAQAQNSTNCYDICHEMMINHGTPAEKGWEKTGHLSTLVKKNGKDVPDYAACRVASEYMDEELRAGRPIVVGVSYQQGPSINIDQITDHFVVVQGKHYDVEAKKYYYTFYDPGSWGSDDIGRSPQNRLYIEADGKIVGQTAYSKTMFYTLSYVKGNSGTRVDPKAETREHVIAAKKAAQTKASAKSSSGIPKPAASAPKPSLVTPKLETKPTTHAHPAVKVAVAPISSKDPASLQSFFAEWEKCLPTADLTTQRQQAKSLEKHLTARLIQLQKTKKNALPVFAMAYDQEIENCKKQLKTIQNFLQKPLKPSVPSSSASWVGSASINNSPLLKSIEMNRASIPINSEIRREGDGYIYLGKAKNDVLPTSLQEPKNEREKFQKKVWKELAGEGNLASINSYDEEVFTWGLGLSAKAGQMNMALRVLFDQSPQLKAQFTAQGIGLDEKNRLHVVDTRNGKVLTGTNAYTLLKNDLRLHSFFIQISEDPANRQAIADAQFSIIAQGAANIPQFVSEPDSEWNDQSIQLAAHFQHWLPTGGWVSEANKPLYQKSRGNIYDLTVTYFRCLEYCRATIDNQRITETAPNGAILVKESSGLNPISHLNDFTSGIALKTLEKAGIKPFTATPEEVRTNPKYKNCIILSDHSLSYIKARKLDRYINKYIAIPY